VPFGYHEDICGSAIGGVDLMLEFLGWDKNPPVSRIRRKAIVHSVVPKM